MSILVQHCHEDWVEIPEGQGLQGMTHHGAPITRKLKSMPGFKMKLITSSPAHVFVFQDFKVIPKSTKKVKYFIAQIQVGFFLFCSTGDWLNSRLLQWATCLALFTSEIRSHQISKLLRLDSNFTVFLCKFRRGRITGTHAQLLKSDILKSNL